MPDGGSQWDGKIQPAQLAFLAIYCPELGLTDETFRDQIVFYYSRATQQSRRSKTRLIGENHELHEQENEKLRQIGLAQGMVSFARGFSNDEPVESIETEKSRIALHELEKGWWILASIDLTRIPTSPSKQPPAGLTERTQGTSAVEYSSREVAPSQLLIQDLIHAHSIFLLHHGPSLSSLYVRLTRQKFCNVLSRYWTQFAQQWDVLLHGNPAADVFGGVKLAAGGELGFGVGEEEWGSGEREVLEDLVGRTEGLVDVVVSRFGEPAVGVDVESQTSTKHSPRPNAWLGYGCDPDAADGVIFGGLGNLNRSSLSHVSHWIATIYRHGEYAYGVGQTPHSDRRRRRRRNMESDSNENIKIAKTRDSQARAQRGDAAEAAGSSKPAAKTQQAAHPGIPRPIVSAAESALNNALSSADAQRAGDAGKEQANRIPKRPSYLSSGSWMRVLTLGYVGSPTSAKTERPDERSEPAEAPLEQHSGEAPLTQLDPAPDGASEQHQRLLQEQQESSGYFLIGLKGDLTNIERHEDEDEADESGNRLLLRTLFVKLTKSPHANEVDGTFSRSTSYDRSTEASISPSGSGEERPRRLRVVVYAHRPFIYAFLFDPQSDSLSIPSFYRSLATHLRPLHKPLCRNTSPATVRARFESAQSSAARTTSSSSSSNPASHTGDQRIYDLIYDPIALTTQTSLPNIPSPGATASTAPTTSTATSAEDELARLARSWTRVEALNVHSQILHILESTRRAPREIERTCKTSRGWWVVWMRVAPKLEEGRGGEEGTVGSQEDVAGQEYRQAILVRKASDWQGGGLGRVSVAGASGGGMFGLRGVGWGGGATSAGAGWGPGRLAEGIGIDARRYVEGLLTLNR
ncbi:MAG: hypothetical protein Q9165_000726 [Trypethelium subeluteriae]